MSDDKIYYEIGQLLLNIAPLEAEDIVIDAELTAENDHCKILFDYINRNGEKNWFLPKSADVDSELFDLLVKLKKFFESNNLFLEGKPWTGCTINFSVRKTTMNIDFKYN